MPAKNAKKTKTPQYRERVPYGQAIVTLTDSVTGQRKDYWLGDYDSPASREMYNALLAEWESKGRRLPSPTDIARAAVHELTITELIHAYKQFVDKTYKPQTRATIYMVLRLLRRYFGSTAATEFGPKRLRLLREQMIKGDATGDPPRKPWARLTVNKALHQIASMFKWGASHEMLPGSVYVELKTVSALRRGRSDARETDPVKPVPVEIVEATKPYLSRQVKALVDLQLLTGARGCELFKLRPVDLEKEDKHGVWIVRHRDHKTAHHHDDDRVIYFGPKAQAVLGPFLVGRPVDRFLFSPAEADAERREAASFKRKTPVRHGNRPGTNRVAEPARKPGNHYTNTSYRRAIKRACDKAVAPRWRPHQLRHAAGTLIRRDYGLETARIVLGHSSALVTDAVYAERDAGKVIDVMKMVG